MLNLPFIGQNYRRHGTRFIADNNGSGILHKMMKESNDQIVGLIIYGSSVRKVWMFPDGSWSSLSLMPAVRYRPLSSTVFVPDKRGFITIRGRYPNFVAVELNCRVWLDTNRVFTTEPIDFVSRAEQSMIFARNRVQKKHRKKAKPIIRKIRRIYSGDWEWQLIESETSKVLMSGVADTHREARDEAVLELRRRGVKVGRLT